MKMTIYSWVARLWTCRHSRDAALSGIGLVLSGFLTVYAGKLSTGFSRYGVMIGVITAAGFLSYAYHFNRLHHEDRCDCDLSCELPATIIYAPYGA